MSKTQDAPVLVMPMATAVWFIDNTALEFEQIADFTGLHVIEIKAIADEEVGRGIVGRDPVKHHELDAAELEKAIEAAGLEHDKVLIDALKERLEQETDDQDGGTP